MRRSGERAILLLCLIVSDEPLVSGEDIEIIGETEQNGGGRVDIRGEGASREGALEQEAGI